MPLFAIAPVALALSFGLLPCARLILRRKKP